MRSKIQTFDINKKIYFTSKNNVELKKDFIYYSNIVSKIINKILHNGKRLKIYNIFCYCLKKIKREFNINPLNFIKQYVVKNIINMHYKIYKKSGRPFYIPYLLNKNERYKYSFQFINKSINIQNTNKLLNKLLKEFYDYFIFNDGISIAFIKNKKQEIINIISQNKNNLNKDKKKNKNR